MRINQITAEPVIDLEFQLDAATAKAVLENYSHVQQLLTQHGYMHVSFNIYSLLRRCADGTERRKDYRAVIEVGAAKIISKHLLDNPSGFTPQQIESVQSVYSELS